MDRPQMEGPNKASPEIIEAWNQRPTPTKSRFCTPTKNPFCRICYLAGEKQSLFLAHNPTDRKRCPNFSNFLPKPDKEPQSSDSEHPKSTDTSENESQSPQSQTVDPSNQQKNQTRLRNPRSRHPTQQRKYTNTSNSK